MKFPLVSLGLVVVVAFVAACKKEASKPVQTTTGNSIYCVPPYGRMVNGECVANEGYVRVGNGFLLESDLPFIAHAPQTGMDSIITNLSSLFLQKASDFIGNGTYKSWLTMWKYPEYDSLGIGRDASYNAYLFTQMPDGGGDSIKFEFVGSKLKTQTGIIHYYGRMNETRDTIRGTVSYRLANIAYPVMWYKLRR